VIFWLVVLVLSVLALVGALVHRRRVLERQIAAYRAERRRLIQQAAVRPNARVDIHFEYDRRRWS
jgi:hypothetical protein